ncbi:MAG: hypothetical protein JKY65_19500 [Planctomycetes bacterium]|nr:hypothetical protein [Planctomycetota bacterium]
MKSKKACAIGCLLAAFVGFGSIGACVWTAVVMTAPVAEASELFLTQIGQGKVSEAYAASASTLRASTSEEEFAASVKELGLADYKSVSWSSRNIRNQEGSVRGTVKTKAGGEIRLGITLRYEMGVWRVATFGAPEDMPETSGSPAAPGAIPAEAELRELSKASLLAFSEANRTKSYVDFHASELSVPFKEKFSPDKLADTFKGFLEGDHLLVKMADVEPVFDAPAVLAKNGVLVLRGHCPTKPVGITFRLKYLFEDPAWKLLAIKVKFAPPPVPSKAELRSLVTASLVALGDALKTEDFTAFHGGLGATFREEHGVSRVATGLSPLAPENEAIAGVGELEPKYDEPPAIDGVGDLKVEGRFVGESKKVLFLLRYRLEEGEWKLLRVEVDVKPVKVQAVPAGEELRRMARATLLAFNEGVKSKSFASFRSEQCSPRFQAKISAAKFEQEFAPFTRRGIDIGGISELDPVFKTPPAVDDDDVLRMKGSYALEPKPVVFELHYDWISDAWKLSRINVSVE